MLRSTNLICWCFAIWCVFNKYDLLTHSMVQSPPWEANWFAASQEIPRISRNPKVHYRTHKPPPTFSILDQPNPVYIPTSNLLEIRTNIIQPSTPRSPQWSLSYRLPHQDRIHPPLLTHTRHMPSPSPSLRSPHQDPIHPLLMHYIFQSLNFRHYSSVQLTSPSVRSVFHKVLFKSKWFSSTCRCHLNKYLFVACFVYLILAKKHRIWQAVLQILYLLVGAYVV